MFKKSLAAALALLAAAAPAAIASEEYGLHHKAIAKASAQLIQPITVYTIQGLDLGAWILGGEGKVWVTPTGEQHADSVSVKRGGQFNKPKAAAFGVYGNRNASYYVTLPEYVTLYSKDGATLNAYGFNTDYYDRKFDEYGKDMFYVGAALDIKKDTAPGCYTGYFEAAVCYTDLNCCE